MGLDEQIRTWTAYDRTTGAPVIVDARTFNPAWHTAGPPSPSAPVPAPPVVGAAVQAPVKAPVVAKKPTRGRKPK